MENKGIPTLQVAAKKQSIEDVKDWSGKRVVMRADFNVPMVEGKITDTLRIDATLPTIKLILQKSADLVKQGKPGIKALVLCSHMGRPKGKVVPKLTMAPIATVLQEKLGVPVKFLPECVGAPIEKAVNAAKGEVFLLENLRFHIEESGKGVDAAGKKIKADKDKTAAFRAGLTRLADIFILEAFGTSHRAHSSIVGIAAPIRAAGLLVKKELDCFGMALGNPKAPVLAILGGAKVTDKIPVITKLMEFCHEIIIGGGMAYTFKKVLENVEIGNSMFDAKGVEAVKNIAKIAAEKKIKLHLPVDHVVGDQFKATKVGVVDDAMGIPKGWLGLDIGPKSRAMFAEVLARANTVLWNGPVGVFENPMFTAGTAEMMYQLVKATKRGAVSVLGGGDTGAASAQFYYGDEPMKKHLTHVSTGGGASLELMEGKILPAFPSLSNK